MFKTLIIEDHDIFRHSLKAILNTGFPSMVIEEACCGKDGMDRIADFKPNLVFMDIGLPDHNGLTLTRMIKSDHSNTKVIIITANDLPEYRQAAMDSGASHFIAKGSFSKDEVLRLVDTTMAGSETPI